MAMDRRKQKNRELKYASAKDRAEKRESGFESTSVNIPDSMSFFSFKKPGIYRIDVMPYCVGKGNPFADPGMFHYERTYYAHRNIGTGQNAYVCPTKTFNKRCPICEHRAKLEAQGGDQETIKSLKPSERQIWIIKDLSNPEEGYQIMDQSHFLFGSLIDAKVAAADLEDEYENFFHLEGGKTLKISVVESSFQGRSFNKPADVEMKPRKQDYDPSVLDDLPCLDELLVEVTYDKLKKIFEAVPGEDTEEEEETPKKGGKGKKPPVEDDDEEDQEELEEDEDSEDLDEEDEPAPKKKGGKTPPKKKPDPDDDDDEPEEPSDLEEDEEDSETEDSAEDDDESDDDDQDEEDEPAPKKKGGKTPPKKTPPKRGKK